MWNVLCQTIHANRLAAMRFIHRRATYPCGLPRRKLCGLSVPSHRIASHRIGTTARREIVLTNLHSRESYMLYVHTRSTKRSYADRARLEFGGKIQRWLPLSPLSFSVSLARFANRLPNKST